MLLLTLASFPRVIATVRSSQLMLAVLLDIILAKKTLYNISRGMEGGPSFEKISQEKKTIYIYVHACRDVFEKNFPRSVLVDIRNYDLLNAELLLSTFMLCCV